MFTIHKKDLRKFQALVSYNSPIPAPIKENVEYAKLVITNTVNGNLEYSLFAKNKIEKAGIFKKLTSALSYLIFGGYAEKE